MRSDPLTLTSIFGKDVRYLVTMFQRPYVWNMKEHWEPLWEDVRSVVERVQSPSDDGDKPVTRSTVAPHFLGAIVLEQIPTGTGSIETRSVIDGQQRLTTLQVLTSAAQVTADAFGLNQQSRLLGKLLLNDRDLISEPDQEFKIWPTNSDRDCFRSIMRNESLSSLDTTMSMKLATAMHYFKSVLGSWASESNEVEREAQFAALVTALRDHLKIVAIDLDPDDNAQVIFETLNARGTPLQAADLMKNLLFQRAEQEGNSVETLYSKYWAPFDRDVWRQEIRQGRLMRPALDVFFGHWLAMTKESETLIHQLFPAFRANLSSSGRTASEVMADLSRSAEVYRRMERYLLNSVEGLFFHRHALMDTTTTIPLLLYIFRLSEEELPVSRRHMALAALESYLVRRMLCRFTSKGYNRIFLDLLSAVKARPSEADAVILRFLQQLEGESQFWPGDAKVRSSLAAIPFYTAFPRKRVCLVLEALEQSMRTDLSEHAHPDDALTIEHILPQHWAENWRLPPHLDPEVATINRDRLKHTLGNLTLVTGKLNPTLSNGPWEEKKVGLRDHSVLRLNWLLLKADPGDWNEDSIQSRTTELTESVLSLWPGPASTGWDTPRSAGTAQQDLPSVENNGALLKLEEKSDADLVRAIIDKKAGTGPGRMLSEALVGELQSWSDVTISPGRSKKSTDGLRGYIMAHRRGSRAGAFLYVYPKADRVRLRLRLPREYSESRPQVFAWDVSPTNVYQVGMQINSLDDLTEALNLADAAFEDAGS